MAVAGGLAFEHLAELFHLGRGCLHDARRIRPGAGLDFVHPSPKAETRMTWMRSNSLARPACFLEWRGDCRYLFDCDVLGYNTGHVPRHSRKHADLAAEHSRIQDIRIDAFRSSVNEVRSGAWPAPEHTVNAPQAEMDAFKKLLTK